MSSTDIIVTHNIATVSADIVYSICNIFHLLMVLLEPNQYALPQGKRKL